MLILSNEEIESLLTVELALSRWNERTSPRRKAQRSIVHAAISIFPGCMKAACTPLKPWKAGWSSRRSWRCG